MNKPENSLHFRRQKIQAEVLGRGSERGDHYRQHETAATDDCAPGNARILPAFLRRRSRFRPRSGRLNLAQRFSAGISVQSGSQSPL
jgi:hypothetical protein